MQGFLALCMIPGFKAHPYVDEQRFDSLWKELLRETEIDRAQYLQLLLLAIPRLLEVDRISCMSYIIEKLIPSLLKWHMDAQSVAPHKALLEYLVSLSPDVSSKIKQLAMQAYKR